MNPVVMDTTNVPISLSGIAIPLLWMIIGMEAMLMLVNGLSIRVNKFHMISAV